MKQVGTVYYFARDVRNNARDEANNSNLWNELRNLRGCSCKLYAVTCLYDYGQIKFVFTLKYLLFECIRKKQ